jgi:16S rRNA (guanine1207-N2)-methyltransferase
MTDLALATLTQALAGLIKNPQGHFLWCTDENALNNLPTAFHHPGLLLMTNRWDVAEEAKARGFTTEFGDFDCRTIADNSLDGFFYRVSKEKPLVHHLLNEAWRCLKPGAPLVLSGYKNEGTKTYIEKITRLMGSEKQIQKDGASYSSVIHKQNTFAAEQALDDSDYHQLRPIAENSGLSIVSKPGLFGWNKVDAGSALLISQIAQALDNKQPETCLDLGCGYGYLTLAAAQLASCKTINRWLLTDNNAAALIAAQSNLTSAQLTFEIIAADAGRHIDQKVDLLLCNPPFHQGFNTDGDLTDKFLESARHLLATDGVALFVVNQFIPLERKAAAHFKNVVTLIDNGSFKVIRLEQPLKLASR